MKSPRLTDERASLRYRWCEAGVEKRGRRGAGAVIAFAMKRAAFRHRPGLYRRPGRQGAYRQPALRGSGAWLSIASI